MDGHLIAQEIANSLNEHARDIAACVISSPSGVAVVVLNQTIWDDECENTGGTDEGWELEDELKHAVSNIIDLTSNLAYLIGATMNVNLEVYP